MTNLPIKQVSNKMDRKNFLKVPKRIRRKLLSIVGNEVDCGVKISLPIEGIRKGRHKRIGVSVENGEVVLKTFEPHSAAGKYSNRNKNGWEVVRKDLPMLTKTFTMESPNFGDWSNGSHEVSHDREVYQREFYPPIGLKILAGLFGKTENEVTVVFRVSETLDRSDAEFDDKLLFQLNILQENLGDADVDRKGGTFEKSINSASLNWEILPPGWWKDKNTVADIKKRLGERESNYFLERLNFFSGLNPEESYSGKSYLGDRSYYVFVFKNVVVAECPEFGNALYYLEGELKDTWKNVFSETKNKALLHGSKRLLHVGDWKVRIGKILSS